MLLDGSDEYKEMKKKLQNAAISAADDHKKMDDGKNKSYNKYIKEVRKND